MRKRLATLLYPVYQKKLSPVRRPFEMIIHISEAKVFFILNYTKESALNFQQLHGIYPQPDAIA
jgi:hypothetical protein